MTYLDDNDFLNNEVLPKINSIVENYFDSEYSYINCEEDLEDLEDAEVTEELMNDVKSSLNKLISECEEDYDFSIIDNKKLDDDELFRLVESAFIDYKEILLNQYAEEFDRENYLDEYYSEIEY